MTGLRRPGPAATGDSRAREAERIALAVDGRRSRRAPALRHWQMQCHWQMHCTASAGQDCRSGMTVRHCKWKWQ
jgi:hypothetical protein